jgi:hypothetical protein
LATYYGHLDVVKWLIREGGSTTTEANYHNQTALLFAAKNGHLNVGKWLLLEGGSVVYFIDYNRNTALLWAATKGHLEVVQWLLRKGGANIMIANYEGSTALLGAAINDHFEIVQWLIREWHTDVYINNKYCNITWAAFLNKLFFPYLKKPTMKLVLRSMLIRYTPPDEFIQNFFSINLIKQGAIASNRFPKNSLWRSQRITGLHIALVCLPNELIHMVREYAEESEDEVWESAADGL